MTLSNKDLLKLQAFDTPTICNALDIASPERRLKGLTKDCSYWKNQQITNFSLLFRPQ